MTGNELYNTMLDCGQLQQQRLSPIREVFEQYRSAAGVDVAAIVDSLVYHESLPPLRILDALRMSELINARQRYADVVNRRSSIIHDYTFVDRRTP